MVQKHTLPNGLTILTQHAGHNDIVALHLFIRMGSRYETDEQAGWSDMTLHLLTKGTRAYSATQLAEAIDSTGARLSTGSGRDSASVSLLATRDRLEEALGLFFEVLLHPTFLAEKVQQEKEMALRRIRAAEDRLLGKAMELLAEYHFGANPYHKPHHGYPESVQAFTPENARTIHRSNFVPNNMVLGAVGPLSDKDLLARVEAHLGACPAARVPRAEEPPLPPRTQPVTAQQERESEAAWLAIGFDAPELSHPDYPAMEVLDAITGGSMDSRLFAELRDRQGLAYQVSSNYVARPGPSVLMAYIGTRPENYEKAREGILRELDRLAEETPPAEEVERAKTYLQGTYIMGQESNSARAALFAQYELYGLGYQFVDRYSERIGAVQPADVQRVAAAYLTRPYTLGAIVPAQGVKASSAIQAGAGLRPQPLK